MNAWQARGVHVRPRADSRHHLTASDSPRRQGGPRTGAGGLAAFAIYLDAGQSPAVSRHEERTFDRVQDGAAYGVPANAETT